VVRLSARELFRQTVHIGAGSLALSLRWVDPLQLSWLALAGFAFNLLVLSRLDGLGLWRSEEERKGRAPGVVLYPLTVWLLLVIFGRQPEWAAAGWGLLAFGDGAASLIGPILGRRGLPWNPAKSWAGLTAYWLLGGGAVAFLVQWVAPGVYDAPFVWAMSFAVALVAALLESMPTRLDDNLAVPLIGALLMACSLWTEGYWSQLITPNWGFRLAIALIVNALLAGAARAMQTLDLSGWVAATLVGGVILGFLGWKGYLLLLIFFLLGSLATRVGYRHKSRLGVAQGSRGARSVWNVLANGTVAAACAVYAAVTPFPELFTVAFAGAMAAATADTLESEIGQLRGGPTYLITSLRPVEVGTDGGVSVTGTLAGIFGSLGVALTGGVLGLYSSRLALAVAVAGLTATLLESVVGASLERRGQVGNHAVNLFNTLAGALLAVGVAAWLSR
jgi:uncharacterized protein (TIGR00297 family)